MRIFADEGQAMTDLLAQWLNAAGWSKDAVHTHEGHAYAQRLLDVTERDDHG